MTSKPPPLMMMRSASLDKPKDAARSASLPTQSSQVDRDSRMIKGLKVASGAVIDRGDYNEVLIISREAINTKHLANKAPLLEDHVKEKRRGAIFGYDIADNFLLVDAKVSRTAEGDLILNDVEDGIIQNVSVRYWVDDFEVLRTGSKPTLVVKRWTPIEVSVIVDPVGPADFSVGFGRSAVDPPLEDPPIMDVSKLIEESSETKLAIEGEGEEMGQRMAGSAANTSQGAGSTGAPDHSQQIEAARQAERSRQKDIMDIARQFNLSEMGFEASQEGSSVEEFRARVMNKIAANGSAVPASRSDLGMSEKEQKQFSLLRICRNVLDAREIDGLEKEVCQAARSKYKDMKNRGGLLIPWEVLNVDLSALRMGGGQRAGGGTVPEIPSTVNTTTLATTIARQIRTQDFVEFLYDQMFSRELGVGVLPGLSGEVRIPTELNAIQADWIDEDDNPPIQSFGTGGVDMKAKTIGARVPLGRSILIQSSLAVESWVRARMAMGLATVIDRTIISGTGRKDRKDEKLVEPKGILQLAKEGAIQKVERASAGSYITYHDLVAMEKAIAKENVARGRFAYLTSIDVAAAAKVTLKSKSKVSPFLWEGPILGGMGTLNDYRAMATNLVPSDIDGKNSAVIFGNWSDLLIGEWGPGIEVLVNPYTENGSVRLRILLDCDIKIAREDSFSVLTDVSPDMPQDAS